MDPKELPPDAGTSTEDAMPPLDAGARSDEYVEDIDDETPESQETPASEAPEETVPDTPAEEGTPEEVPEDTVDPKTGEDEDVLKALLGDDAQPGIPEGVSEDDWKAFQEFKKAQEQAQAEPPQAAAPEEVPIEPLTEEDFGAAFETADGFKNAISKSLGNFAGELKKGMYDDLDQAMVTYGNHLLARMEQMFYIRDAISEVPEIANYPQAFQVALNKTMANRKPGDLEGPVREALELFKTNMARAEAIKKTKNVDVRGKQQAPKVTGSSSRQAHTQPQGEDVDDSAMFLSGVWKKRSA